MEDYGSLLTRCRTAFSSGRSVDLAWRKRQLNQMASLLDNHQEEFAKALHDDLKKPRQESLSFEVEFTLNCIRQTLANIDEWTKDEYVEKNLLTLLDTTYIHREPVGVALVIGAWNYPVQLTLAPVVGAIAAGNAVVIKPSEVSPKTADLMQRLIHQYMDPELIRVVTGGIPETTELLKHKFDYIFYTGSYPVGKIIAQAAAKHLTPCTFELGGKCPSFIDENLSNLDYVVKRILWGKMINCGQTCVAPDYLLCTEKVKDQLVKKFKEILEEFYGDKKDNSEDIGRIVNDRNYQRLVNLLNSTNGTFAIKGATDEKDLNIGFNLVTDIKENDCLMQDEIFGPILPILTVKDAAEAAKFISNREKPLSFNIFSENKKTVKFLVENTSSGSICINDTIVQLTVDTLPFGGVGASGYGNYHGKYTYQTFSHSKSVLVRDLGYLGELLGMARYPPYSDTKVTVTKNLLKSRKLPGFGWFGYLLAFGLGLLATTLYNKYVESL